jgi:hypothetical protein
MIVASIFAIVTLAYVAVDIVLEILMKKKNEPVPIPEPEPEPIPEPEPEPEPEIEIIETEPVEIPEDTPIPEVVEEGTEVIDVAWPESMAKNKIYRYDPDGIEFQRGDRVLVPTFDRHRRGEIARAATVINGNYRTQDLPADRILKKVIRKVEKK